MLVIIKRPVVVMKACYYKTTSSCYESDQFVIIKRPVVVMKACYYKTTSSCYESLLL